MAVVDGVEISSVRWLDNKSVTLLSTFTGSMPVSEVTRWNGKTTSYEKVTCPNIVTVNNKHMGGVDLIDSLIGLYRINLRSKKWYHRLFFHLVDMTVINVWLLYRRQIVTGDGSTKAMSLHEFKANAAEALCRSGMAPTSNKRGRPSSGSSSDALVSNKRSKLTPPEPCVDVRYDGLNHLPKLTDERIRCKKDSTDFQKYCFQKIKCPSLFVARFDWCSSGLTGGSNFVLRWCNAAYIFNWATSKDFL